MTRSLLLFRVHAVQRMFERGITVEDVTRAIRSGEVIEDYSSEMAGPGRLILGYHGKRAMHVVAAEDENTDKMIIITAYLPNAGRWSKDYKSRRS